MIKKFSDFLAGIPMTIVGGVLLGASLIIMLSGTNLPTANIGFVAILLDPAWVALFISGNPLLYLTISRIINNPGMKKISSAHLISIAMMAAVGIGDIFAAAEVAFIMAIGAILEEKTTERAKRGRHKLINLPPQQGRRINGGQEEMIKV